MGKSEKRANTKKAKRGRGVVKKSATEIHICEDCRFINKKKKRPNAVVLLNASCVGQVTQVTLNEITQNKNKILLYNE